MLGIQAIHSTELLGIGVGVIMLDDARSFFHARIECRWATHDLVS
jgi:hypothetical protein